MFTPITISITDHAELLELVKTDNLPPAFIRAVEKENFAISIGEKLYLVKMPKHINQKSLERAQKFTLKTTYFTNVVSLVESPDAYNRARDGVYG